MKEYLTLDKLKVYQLARKLSQVSWQIYQKLDWKDKKIIGDQFIQAADSCGANIAEGYGRFHYLDKVRFYYNARGSLLESRHWLELLRERDKIDEKDVRNFLACYQEVRPSFAGLIKSTLQAKNSKTSIT